MDEIRNNETCPSATMVNIFIDAWNHLKSIPRNFSYSFQLLELEDHVVDVGEYYYNNSTKGIKRRSSKRKRDEASLNKESSDRVIMWKVGPDTKVNALENTSCMSVFVGAKSISVCELSASLDICKTRII
jgi:hypothetical protein